MGEITDLDILKLIEGVQRKGEKYDEQIKDFLRKLQALPYDDKKAIILKVKAKLTQILSEEKAKLKMPHRHVKN